MHTITAFLLLSTWFVLFNIVSGFECPRGGYNNNQPQFGPGCIYRCHCVADGQCDNDTGACPGGCAEGWMGPGCQYGDIAFSKTAWQSSNTGSEKVVDGNPSTCSEINETGEKWWRVDLNGLYRITGLVIVSNSPDALKGFGVRVGNISSNSAADFRSICFNHSDNENVSAVTPVVCTSELVGKHLMITIPELQTKLELCDVRVYGGRTVAYRRFANQSSVYHIGVASRAVDGGTSTRYGDNTCTHTLEERSPRWMVDLEQVYYISRIEIFNRQDCCADCPDNLCGWYCESPCFCANPVDKRNKIDGNCPKGCAENWYGSKCNLCYIDRGDVCVNICGKCRQGTLCNASDGTCVDGCQPGWWNLSCESECNYCNKNTSCTHLEGICSECSTGRWGPYCQYTCTNCRVATGCNISNGSCLKGCLLGRFDVNCDKPCGQCGGDGSCDRDYGHCNNFCLPGWMNNTCTNECPSGWFGVNCGKECGHCANKSSCHRINGTCLDGCSPGYTDSTCDKVCPSGFFGLHCSQRCYHCADGSSCHHVNGSCLNGCDSGYIGPMCDTDCPEGHYGYNCSEECGSCYNHTVCEHINGDCRMGCQPYFTGYNCKEGLATEKNTDGGEFNPKIIGIIVGVCLCALLIGIAVGCFLTRIRMRRSASASASATSAGPEGTYDQLDRDNVPNDISSEYEKIQMKTIMKH